MRHFARHIRPTMTAVLAAGAVAAAAALGGCSAFTTRKADPPPVEWPMESPYAEVRTIAIAPAINLSGSRDFDVLVVSDLLFGELEQVRGVNVLPLNKTLMAMQKLGVRNIENVQTAQKLAEMLGADGLIVPAVTAYDPYNPPTVGMILQMYTPRANAAAAAVPARGGAAGGEAKAASLVSISMGPEPAAMATVAAAAGAPPAAPVPGGNSNQPVSQVNAIFQGTNQSVLRELHNYAAGRTEYDSALGEERFVMDADSYMRFVCHAMVRRLMDVERGRGADR